MDRDRRPLVLLALGGLILASGFLGPGLSLRTTSTTSFFLEQRSGKTEQVRRESLSSSDVQGEVFSLSHSSCAEIPPRYALFFGLPLPVNRADFTSLTLLPGIGPGKAEALLSFRSQHGRFARAEDLARVRGIGPNLVNRLQPLLCFD